MWAAWESYLTATRDILGLRLDSHASYAAWEQAAVHGGFRMMRSEFAMVCAFPDVLHVDDQGRPHCADGPSHRWSDGFEIYHWRGVVVPCEWIMSPRTMDARSVLAESNLEKRRAGMEIMLASGGASILDQIGARLIDRDTDPAIGSLYVADLPDAPATKLLHVRCGTGREFVLFVAPGSTTALEGNASTYEGISPRELRQMMQART